MFVVLDLTDRLGASIASLKFKLSKGSSPAYKIYFFWDKIQLSKPWLGLGGMSKCSGPLLDPIAKTAWILVTSCLQTGQRELLLFLKALKRHGLNNNILSLKLQFQLPTNQQLRCPQFVVTGSTKCD